MGKPTRAAELSYEARARIADNVFLQRKRVGYSQEALGERAMLTTGRIAALEDGKVLAKLDAYVRLAGSLSITLDDLLAGVRWTPSIVESEIEAGYIVEFEIEAPKAG